MHMATDQIHLNHGKKIVEDIALERKHPHATRHDSTAIERKFVRLRDEWRAKRKPESSSIKLGMHPAYLKIIGMGPDVVPLLLRELATNGPESWFLALMAITEADPVPSEHRGDGVAMTQAWIQWGKDQGYQW